MISSFIDIYKYIARALFCFLSFSLYAQNDNVPSLPQEGEFFTELTLSRSDAIGVQNKRNALRREIEPIAKDIVSWYNLLNRNPEIGYQEKKTASFLARLLESFGWKVNSDIGSGHSIAAVWDEGRPGKTILIKVDMDALPYTDRNALAQGDLVNSAYNFGGRIFYLMHGAGHDAHMAIALGLAKYIAQDKGRINGKIILAFQSGEYSTALGGAHGSDILLQNSFFLENKPDFSIGFQVDPNLSIGEIGIVKGATLPSATIMNVNIYAEQKTEIDFADNTNTLYSAFAHMIEPARQIAYEERFLLGKAIRIDFNAINGAPFIDVPAQEIEASAMIIAFSDEEACHAQDRLSLAIERSAQSMGVMAAASFYPYAPLMANSPSFTNMIAEIGGLGGKLHIMKEPPFYFNSFSKYAKASRAGGFFFLIGGGDSLRQKNNPSYIPSSFSIPSDKYAIDPKSLSAGLISLRQILMLAEKADLRPLK